MMKMLRKYRGFRNPRLFQRVKKEILERESEERDFKDKLVTDEKNERR